MSDTSGSGFGKFVPGFEFLQNLAGQAAGGVVQGLGNSIPQLPNLSHWVAPTVNVEDLEKRIEELKAVHFWLDQNAKALGADLSQQIAAHLQQLLFEGVGNAWVHVCSCAVVGEGRNPTRGFILRPPPAPWLDPGQAAGWRRLGRSLGAGPYPGVPLWFLPVPGRAKLWHPCGNGCSPCQADGGAA